MGKVSYRPIYNLSTRGLKIDTLPIWFLPFTLVTHPLKTKTKYIFSLFSHTVLSLFSHMISSLTKTIHPDVKNNERISINKSIKHLLFHVILDFPRLKLKQKYIKLINVIDHNSLHKKSFFSCTSFKKKKKKKHIHRI
jgi:hypothetical protein